MKMGDVYLDPDAIRRAQGTLRDLGARLQEEAQRHAHLEWHVDGVLRAIAPSILSGLNPQRWFDPHPHWLQGGFDGIVRDCQTSHGIVHDIRDAVRQVIEQLHISHGDVIGGGIVAHAADIDPELWGGMNCLADLVAFFHPDNLLWFLREPWVATGRFADARGKIAGAASTIDEFARYLDRVYQRAEDVIWALLAPYKAPAGPPAPDNLATLYKNIDKLYGPKSMKTTPIEIQEGTGPDGKPTLLVMLAGVHSDSQDNSLGNAIGVGSGIARMIVPNDPYERDVTSAIKQYLKARGLPDSTPIIVAGHSYGGMVAQELAADKGSTHFNVQYVITYGSPNLGLHTGNTKTFEYANRYDVVPWLSTHEMPVLRTVIQHSEQQGVRAGIGDFTDLRIKHVYTGETIVDGGAPPHHTGLYNPLDDVTEPHGAYGSSQDLKLRPVPFTIHDVRNTAYMNAAPGARLTWAPH